MCTSGAASGRRGRRGAVPSLCKMRAPLAGDPEVMRDHELVGISAPQPVHLVLHHHQVEQDRGHASDNEFVAVVDGRPSGVEI